MTEQQQQQKIIIIIINVENMLQRLGKIGKKRTKNMLMSC